MGLLDLKPHEVSRDLRGYSVMFYGTPRVARQLQLAAFLAH